MTTDSATITNLTEPRRTVSSSLAFTRSVYYTYRIFVMTICTAPQCYEKDIRGIPNGVARPTCSALFGSGAFGYPPPQQSVQYVKRFVSLACSTWSSHITHMLLLLPRISFTSDSVYPVGNHLFSVLPVVQNT